jgi:hypothetical protein
MRIGIDARLVFYHQAGIGQYIMRLTDALASLDREDEFYLFQSRKDSTRLANAPNFHRRVLWTPSHHRFERLAMSAEMLPYTLDVLHSPDFIPPRKTRAPNVITVHDLAFLTIPEVSDARCCALLRADRSRFTQRRAHHRRLAEHETRRNPAAGRAR